MPLRILTVHGAGLAQEVTVGAIERVQRTNLTNRKTTMTTQLTTLNGLNLEQMEQTIGALTSDASLARFEFRASNRWLYGGHNRSTVQGFYGAGGEDSSRSEAFVLDNGEPPVLLGNNNGANPVEYLLHALAGCLTTTFVLHAAARGIRLHEVSTELAGDIDVLGLLDLDPSAVVGYEEIRIKMQVKADASDEVIEDLIEFAKAHSPVCNTICRPVSVNLSRQS
jgi:uncharacterized OsmC-like protein